MKWVYGALLLYAVGFALYWPRTFLVVDEVSYVGQAVAFSRGHSTIPDAGVIHPAPRLHAISDYPPGTSLLQAPFVRAFGWRGAALLSVLALIGATLVTARWLQVAGRLPAFALIIPGYLGAALFGRIAMSDVPATALVAGACYLAWTAGGRAGRSALAAFFAGAILWFREPPVLIVAPLLLGGLVRRELPIIATLAAGFVAVAGRLIMSSVLFGAAWYARDPGLGFSISSLTHSIPIFALLLLVMLPAGALLPFLYRGPRRPELLAGFASYLTLFLLFEYNSVADSGLVKGLMNASRYAVPLLPVLAFQAADVWPRLYRRLRQRDPRWALLPRAGLLGVLAVSFLIHPVANRQERVPLSIVQALYSHTDPRIPLITNTDATLKYLNVANGPRRLILRYGLSADSLSALTNRYGALGVAFLDRRDSDHFRHDADENRKFLASIAGRCDVREKFDRAVATWARVRVYGLEQCR